MRARLIAGGGDAFHDYELLEYLLALVTPRRDTKPLAKRLIGEFGTLSAVLAATPAELQRVDGLGETGIAAMKFVQAAAVRALRDDVVGRPLLSSWQAVLDYLHADMAHGRIERFRVLFLDNKNVLIRSELMAEGTVNQTPVYVREVFSRKKSKVKQEAGFDRGTRVMQVVHRRDPWRPRSAIARRRSGCHGRYLWTHLYNPLSPISRRSCKRRSRAAGSSQHLCSRVVVLTLGSQQPTTTPRRRRVHLANPAVLVLLKVSSMV